ncbi:MAG: tRNA (adenosine(37)-N6)-dimethylallyltransferase MiaA [Saprospiraceae bacterium]
MHKAKKQENKYIIIIAGPTAVGKTAISIKIAKKLGCEIFSADSRQIYKELNIGTAKPTIGDLTSVRHHMINYISVTDDYNVGHYVADLRRLLNEYFHTHNVAILTGGSGLYIKALMEGLDDFPEVPDDILTDYNTLFEKEGIETLQAELKIRDPMYFNKADLSNHRRLIRALGVCKVSGLPYTSFLSNKKNETAPYDFIQILLELPRDVLYRRINERVNMMMDAGLLNEVRSLLKYRELKSLDTVGYRELFNYLDAHEGLESAIDMIKQNSRRYAKRQMTWFNKYGDWTRFSSDDYDAIEKFVFQEIKV